MIPGNIINLLIYNSIKLSKILKHFIFYIIIIKKISFIIDTKNNIEWKTPEEAGKKCTIAES